MKWMFSLNNALQQGSVGSNAGCQAAFTNHPAKLVALAALGCDMALERPTWIFATCLDTMFELIVTGSLPLAADRNRMPHRVRMPRI